MMQKIKQDLVEGEKGEKRLNVCVQLSFWLMLELTRHTSHYLSSSLFFLVNSIKQGKQYNRHLIEQVDILGNIIFAEIEEKIDTILMPFH